MSALEASYRTDYRFLPSQLLKRKARANLNNDDLIVFSVLRDIESCAASRRRPRWDEVSVYFDISKTALKNKYGLSSYRMRSSLTKLFKVGAISDPSDHILRITNVLSGYERNKSGNGYHARTMRGIRIPRILDQYTELSASDKIAFSILLNKAMGTRIRDVNGMKYADCFHEEMMDSLNVKSLSTLLAIYERLERAGLIHREKNSFRFYLPLLTVEESTEAPISDGEAEKSPSFIEKKFDTDTDTNFSHSLKPTVTNNQQYQDSFSSVGECTGENGTNEGKESTPPITAIEQINGGYLMETYPDKRDVIQNLIDRMDFAYNCKAATIRVNGASIATIKVRERLREIKESDIIDILPWFDDFISKVDEGSRNNYTLTCLFNFKRTNDFHRKKTSGSKSDVEYKDNRYIPSNDYDYDNILEEHRKRLYEKHKSLKERMSVPSAEVEESANETATVIEKREENKQTDDSRHSNDDNFAKGLEFLANRNKNHENKKPLPKTEIVSKEELVQNEKMVREKQENIRKMLLLEGINLDDELPQVIQSEDTRIESFGASAVEIDELSSVPARDKRPAGGCFPSIGTEIRRSVTDEESPVSIPFIPFVSDSIFKIGFGIETSVPQNIDAILVRGVG